MASQHINSLDAGFGEWLRGRARPISRRSMLGRSIQLLMGLAGVTIGAGSIRLFADLLNLSQQTAMPPGFDPTCSNLHGVLCAGNCSPSAAGATDCLQSDLTQKQAAWVGCCKRTDTKNFQCYTMADIVCATRPTNWLVNCPGNTPTGRIWFGGKLGKRHYVCTIPTAVGAQYASGADCANNCTPDLYPNTWAC